jgi:hypothetical protein
VTKQRISIIFRLLAACSLWLAACNLNAQAYDTLCNWDGINQDWIVSTPGWEVVENPAPDEVNSSAHCFKFITDESWYEYMLYEMEQPANFDLCPHYRLKVLAPESGGNITMKFENYNNTYWQEIELTPVPGQWTDLEYDFSGLPYNELIKMVIFPDFQGTTPGNSWYIDDILRDSCAAPGPLELESNLPIIVINTFDVPIPNEPKIPAHMGIIDNGPGVPNNLNDPFTNYDGNIGIEIRGQSSQMFPKNSYGFETRDNLGEDLDASLLGLPEENDWVLYAPYSDKSLLRNIMSFEMGRAMGNYCSRSVFCEVVINDDYKGIYTLMEKIKKDSNRVDIATLNPDEILGDDLTGGYMIKVDKIDPDFVFNVDGWKSDPSPAYPNAMDITFQYYYPESDELAGEQRSYIRNFVTEAENTLTMYYFSNPYIGYQQYFDVPTFIDALILSEIPKEVDKYRYSTYFYKEKDSDGGKLFAGPAWDFDLGYGNVDYWEPGIQTYGWLYSMVEPVDWGIMFWWKRLMEDPYFKDMTKSRYAYLRQNQLSNEILHQKIDSITTLLDSATVRNFGRWPILGQYVWPNYDWYGNAYEDEVDYFEDFLFNRLAWMDANFSGSIVEPAAGISAQDDKITLALYGDFFRRPVLHKSQFHLNNAPPGVFIQSVGFISASECRLVLNANMANYPDVTVTVDEEAVNYWLDITSNPLSAAGAGDLQLKKDVFRVYEENGRIHLLCTDPDIKPELMEIYNLAGQLVQSSKFKVQNECVIYHSLKPGLYLMVVETKGSLKVLKFNVSGL